MLFADQIRIDPAYRPMLEACQLLRVNDILARIAGRVAAWSRTTETIHVSGPAGAPGFYLKRYFYPTWRKRLRGTFRGTFFGTHRGQAEYHALKNMRALGISAVRPVAYGARRIGNFVTACFLITEEVPGGCNLTTFAGEVRDGRRHLTPVQRLAVIRRLARQVAHMHAAGFSHGQLFWRNIIIRPGPDGVYEFFFLDAQPPRRWQRLGSGGDWWQTELAHLNVSALPFISRSARLRFLLEYARATRLTSPIKARAHEITTRSQRWRQHEIQRIKMNNLFEQWNRQLEDETPLSAQSPTIPKPGM